MLHTLTGAVAATGLDASTILAAIRSGEITANQDLFGEWYIEDDELELLRSSIPSPNDVNESAISTAVACIPLGHQIGDSVRSQRPWRGSQQAVVDATPRKPGSVGWSALSPISDYDIHLDARDKVAASISSVSAHHTPPGAIAGALLVTLAIGWVGGLFSHLLWQSDPLVPLAPSSGSQKTLSGPNKPGPQFAQKVEKTGKFGSKPNRFSDSPDYTQSIAQGARSTKKSNTVDDWVRPISPIPETRPTTIEGWTVREVVGGVATLDGPDGLRRAAAGDIVPGLGRVNSIVLWGSRWIVATSRGLITTD
jgi:hypothetical protein